MRHLDPVASHGIHNLTETKGLEVIIHESIKPSTNVQ